MPFWIILASNIGTLGFCSGQSIREKRVFPVDGQSRQTFERQPKIAVIAGVGE
jgi:hypothetical protein